MTSTRRYEFVLAVYPSTRGLSFVLFEGFLSPVDWGVHEARGLNKNAQCLKSISKLFIQHTPDVLVIQDMSATGTRRAWRIESLNRAICDLAEMYGTPVCAYSRVQVRECFARLGFTTKHDIAGTIAKHIPALDRYMPPVRKPWMSEDARMGLFDAAALAWTFFHTNGSPGESAG
jgi:hypothetical protein